FGVLLLEPSLFARSHGLFTLLRRGSRNLDGQVPGPGVLKPDPLVALAVNTARQMHRLGPDAKAAPAGAATPAATAQQRGQRILGEAPALSPCNPRPFLVCLELFDQRGRQDATGVG